MNLNSNLQTQINAFKASYPLPDLVKDRLQEPSMPFYGTKILTQAVTALLQGENLLLCGDKATGKNILAEIWHGFSDALSTTFPFTSTQTAVT